MSQGAVTWPHALNRNVFNKRSNCSRLWQCHRLIGTEFRSRGSAAPKQGSTWSKGKWINIAPLLYYRLTLKQLSYGSHSVTCKMQIAPYLPLPRKRSPDGATTGGSRHLIAAYYSFIEPKGWNDTVE